MTLCLGSREPMSGRSLFQALSVCAALTWDFLSQEHLPRRDGWCWGGFVNALVSSFPPYLVASRELWGRLVLCRSPRSICSSPLAQARRGENTARMSGAWAYSCGHTGFFSCNHYRLRNKK